MRFFSSSALASAPKLRFAASCSAAETMSRLSPAAPLAASPVRLSAGAGHYLVLGFDKSIVLSADRPRFTPAMTQMLRGLAFFLLGRSQNLHRAAGLFDRLDRGFRGAVHLDGDLGLEFATAEQPQAVLGAAQHAGLDQRFGGDGFLDVDQLGVDRLLQPVEIDLREIQLEDIGEATL